jgi:hypothetical protein
MQASWRTNPWRHGTDTHNELAGYRAVTAWVKIGLPTAALAIISAA